MDAVWRDRWPQLGFDTRQGWFLNVVFDGPLR